MNCLKRQSKHKKEGQTRTIMNLKYYLRGLGLGIIVTAIILAVGIQGKKESISDEEVVARAKELGMIENTVLSARETEKEAIPSAADKEENLTNELEADYTLAEEALTNETEVDSTLAEETLGQEATEADDAMVDNNENNSFTVPSENTLEKQAAESEALSANGENTELEAERLSANGENTELEAESSTEDESSQFIVQVGEAPSSISERLEEGGWITNAEEFTVFLVNNGYDTVIVAAEYQIPFDADMEAIAKIITKNKRIRSRPTQPEIPTMPETSPVTQ